MRGMRHGYGVRTSATFGLASHYRPKSARGSMSSIPASEQADPATDRDRKIDDFRGGFVLKSRSDEPPTRRRSLVEKSTSFKKSILQGLKIKKQRSTGDIDRRGVSSIRSSGSNLSSASSESSHSGVTHGSIQTDSNVSFVSQDELCDAAVTETYMGEWKNDKRCGFGIAERSDGLKYEGEWYNNKKYGYGVTTLKDGTREEGKYKNNVLVSSGKKKHLFMLRSAKFKERIEAAVQASHRGSQIALQKADIAISRTATARGKAEQADISAIHAQEDSNIARLIAKQFDPDIKIPGPDTLKNKFQDRMQRTPFTNLSNQTLSPHSQESLRTESSLDVTRHNRSQQQTPIRTPSQNEIAQTKSYQYPPNYANAPPQPDIIRYPVPQAYPPQGRYGPQQTYPPPQQTYPSQPQGYTHTQAQSYPQPQSFPPQQQSYPPQRPSYTQSQPSYPPPQPNYPPQQPNYPLQQQQSYQPQQQQQSYPPPQQSYPHPQPQPAYQKTNYLGDPPVVPNRQGSFRRASMQQAMGDHFEHYRQEPRPRTVIKHGRRIPSPPRSGYGPDATPDSGVSESMDGEESLSPARFSARKGIYDSHTSSLLSFAPSEEDGRTASPTMSELGSEASSASGFPRTASLYVNPPSRKKAVAPVGGGEAAMRRKKSMPHGGPKENVPQKVIPREEVAFLSSQRREEVRRMQYETERLRSNPLLYLVRPDLKDWFSRQQLILLVLFINISLAVLFFKLLS